MTFLRKTSLVTFCDGRSMTILVTQRKCHHCNSVTKTHVFSDDNRSSWIVKSLVVVKFRSGLLNGYLLTQIQQLYWNCSKLCSCGLRVVGVSYSSRRRDGDECVGVKDEVRRSKMKHMVVEIVILLKLHFVLTSNNLSPFINI